MTENRRHMIESAPLKNVGIPLLAMYSNTHAKDGLITHNHQSCFEICYLKRGSQTYFIDGTEYIIVGGDVLVVFPYENHSTGSQPENRGCLYWLQADSLCRNFLGLAGDECGAILTMLKNIGSRIVRVSDETASKLVRAYSLLEEGTVTDMDMIAARSLLIAFIYELCCQSHGKDERSDMSDQISLSVRYISDHIRERIPIRLLAEMLSFSESHFKFKFKKEIGVPPGEYIMQQKIYNSVPLLSAHTLTYIAYEYGFSSSQHYSRMFKSVMGLTPKEYRIKMKNSGTF